jgi:mannose-6-phosphate isomerase-like protein (cupin superfamily)
MNTSALIESGLLEQYCLGLLPPEKNRELAELERTSPEIRAEVEAIESALRVYSHVSPKQGSKEKVRSAFSSLSGQETIDLSCPPLVHRHSDYRLWNTALQNIVPEKGDQTLQYTLIRDTPEVELTVIWLYGEVTEEPHPADQFLESFLVLEGSCVCSLEGSPVALGTGDLLEVPSDIEHTVTPTSIDRPYMLVQRKKVVSE